MQLSKTSSTNSHRAIPAPDFVTCFRSLVMFVATTAMLSGCSLTDSRKTSQETESSIAGSIALVSASWPADAQTRVTTSGDIYLANLDSQIASLKQRVASRPNDQMSARLALLRYHRFQIKGTLADAEVARDELTAAHQRPHDPAVDLALVQVLLGFHQYSQAKELLQHAQQSGAASHTVEEWEKAITSSTQLKGMPIDPDANKRPELQNLESIDSLKLVAAAAEQLELGFPQRASVLLKAAQDNFAGSSPYVLAWIHVQQGIAFLRHQQYSAARKFFAAAHERFPQYAVATEHLAEVEMALGHLESAVELYREVAAQTGNPEFFYRLSVAEQTVNLDAEAEQHAIMARQGYRALVSKYPLMYADHAARYYMDTGDVLRAYELAQMNFLSRQDIRATGLLIETGLMAGDEFEACTWLWQTRKLGYSPPELAPGRLSHFKKCNS